MPAAEIRYHEMTTLTSPHDQHDDIDDDDDRLDIIKIASESTFIKGLTGNLVLAIAAAVCSSAFQHGYNTGVVNTPQTIIESFIRETYFERHNATLTTEEITVVWSTAVAIFCFGGMVGGLLTGLVAETCGRKLGLLLNNINVLIAAILMGFSKEAKSYEMIIAGRFFIGVCSGLNAGLVPMYLAEITPAAFRGAVGTTYQLVVTISILIAQILGMPYVLGSETHWPVLLGIIIIPAVFQSLVLPFCPESPKFIYINEGKEIKAQKALVWLRGTPDIQDEMIEMRSEIEAAKLLPKVSMREMFTNPLLRLPLIISVMMMLSQQFSGINAVMFFSTSIFQSAGLTGSVPMYATLGMGVTNVIMTLISLVLIEKAGRRILHLTGLGGCIFTTFLLTVCFEMQRVAEWTSYISIVLVFLFVMFFAIGPGSIPWFLVSELFGQGPRSLATSIAVGVNWAANFIVTLAFLPLSKLLNGYTFLLFTALLALFWMFTYKCVPETKNKTAEEVSAYFRQKVYNEAPYQIKL